MTVTVDDLVPIGQVIKTIGYKSNILVRPYEGFNKTWENVRKCVIRVNGILAPFFIEKSELHNDELELKFDAYHDDKSAHDILHQEIYVIKDQVSTESEEEMAEDDLGSWIGFKVMDASVGELGLIEDIEELPGQFLIHLTYNGKEIVIPFAEELVLDVDVDNKILTMELPEGILDL